GKYPLAQRIEDKKRGIGRQRYPFAVWVLTAAMIGVMIYELVYNDKEQGNPFSFKPVVNPMLGPSSSGLIHLGARFPACMKDVSAIPVDTQLACPNNTANPVTRVCDLEEVCGFGGFHSQTPNQWFRFITPIFLHAGIVHILLNMVAQLTVSAQIEREMGSGGFLLTYFAAGIFGNVLGGNFALVGLPSTGASGAIFGTVAVTWVDLLAHWRYHYRPGRKASLDGLMRLSFADSPVQLAWMIVELLLGVAMGYIPCKLTLNLPLAHLGGFLMGLLVGMFFYPVISVTKQHKGVVWGFRLVALPLIIVLFVVLIRNFYTTDPNAACPGCRYLSCLPLKLNQVRCLPRCQTRN
ncbi:rhomboid-domain-containing protein, partial [Punctularia strigosozonata HHB-11173 SS5]|uniref:rhomboid-domain-containing protein n=1 Tax=Punctularia strigosozonata (strain HHB-11173) TaxID=741275 RepID=UPI0004417F3C